MKKIMNLFLIVFFLIGLTGTAFAENPQIFVIKTLWKATGNFTGGLSVYMNGELICKEFNQQLMFPDQTTFDAYITEYNSELTWEEVQTMRQIKCPTPLITKQQLVDAIFTTKAINMRGDESEISNEGRVYIPKPGVPIFFLFTE